MELTKEIIFQSFTHIKKVIKKRPSTSNIQKYINSLYEVETSKSEINSLLKDLIKEGTITSTSVDLDITDVINLSSDLEHSKLDIKLIRDTMTELLYEQEQKILKSIEENSNKLQKKINMLETKLFENSKKLSQIENENAELKRSIQFQQNQIEQEQCKVTEEVKIRDEKIDFLKEKCRELEDRQRRNNIRIDGLPESANETWQETETKLKGMLADKLGVESIEIERAHRTKSKSNGIHTIAAKLLNYKDKVRILRKSHLLKDTDIYIYEDFCKETVAKRKGLWAKVLDLRKKGRFATLIYDRIYEREHRPRQVSSG